MDKSKRIIKITDEANSKIYVQNDNRPTISFLSAATLVVKRLLLPNSEIYFSSVQKIDFDDSVIQIHIHDEYNVHYVNIEDSNVVIDWSQGSFIISIEPSNIVDCDRPEAYYEFNETNKAKNNKVYVRLKQDGLLTYFIKNRAGFDGKYDDDKIKKLEKLSYPIKEDNYFLYHDGTRCQVLKIKQTPQYFSKKESVNLYTECIYDTFDANRVGSISNCGLDWRISNLDMYTFDKKTIFVDTLNDNTIIKGFEDSVDETLMKLYTSENFRIKCMDFIKKLKTHTSTDDRKEYLNEIYDEALKNFLFGDPINEGINIVFLLENGIIDLQSLILTEILKKLNLSIINKKLERKKKMSDITKTSIPESPIEKIKAINPHIVVTGKPDKPLYNICYYDMADDMWYMGYSSYELKFVFEWLNTYFEVVDCSIEDDKCKRCSYCPK